MLQKTISSLLNCAFKHYSILDQTPSRIPSLLAGIPKSVVDTRPISIWSGFSASAAYEICKTDVWQSHGKCWLANTKDRNPQPRRAKNKEKCHRGKLLIDEIRTGSEFV